MLPGRAVQSRPAAPAHDLVIGRVELDEVEGKALLVEAAQLRRIVVGEPPQLEGLGAAGGGAEGRQRLVARCRPLAPRSEEHTSELQSLMRISYAVFCLKKKKQ